MAELQMEQDVVDTQEIPFQTLEGLPPAEEEDISSDSEEVIPRYPGQSEEKQPQQTRIDLDPKIDLNPPKRKEQLSEADTSLAAEMYSVAKGDVLLDELEKIRDEISFQGTANLKNSIDTQRTGELPSSRSKALDAALTAGDVDAAEAIIKYNPQRDTPEVSVALSAGENSVASRITNPSFSSPLDLSVEPEINAKLVIINNAILDVMKAQDEKYSPTQRESELLSVPQYGEAGIVPVGAWHLVGDILGGVVAMHYAWNKAESDNPFLMLGQFLWPGSGSQQFSKKVFDPRTSVQELDSVLRARLITLKKEFKNNPMKAAQAMLNELFTDQANADFKIVKDPDAKGFRGKRARITTEVRVNPFLERLRNIKSYVDYQVDGTAVTRENIIPEIYNPNSALDRTLYSSEFQNIVDNPAWDIGILQLISRTTTRLALLGADGEASILVKEMVQENAGMGAHFASTQYRGPPTPQSVDTGIEVQKILTVARESIIEHADPPRVTLPPEVLDKEIADFNSVQFLPDGAAPPVVTTGSSSTALTDPQTGLTLNSPIAKTVSSGSYLTEKNRAYITPIVDGGNNFLLVGLQAPSGEAFRTPEAAVRYADEMGFTEWEIIHDSPSKYYLEIRHALSDEGGILPAEGPPRKQWWNPLQQLARTRITSTAANPFTANLSDPQLVAGASAAAKEAAKFSSQFNRISKTIQALSKEEFIQLSDVILEGMRTPNPLPDLPGNTGKWFSENQLLEKYLLLHNREPSTTERAAYFAMKIGMDLSYTLQTKAVVDPLVAQGFNSWVLPGLFKSPVVARIEAHGASIPAEAKILLGDGTVVTRGSVPAGIMGNEDFVLLKMYGRVVENDVHYAMVRRGQARSTGLSWNVLGYREGGARVYENVFYVKSEGAGRGSRALSVHETKSKATGYRNKLEAIKDVYRQYLKASGGAPGAAPALPAPQALVNMRSAVAQKIQDIHSHWSLERVEKAVETGELDLASKLHVLYDREPMPNTPPSMQGIPEVYQVNGRLYNSPKGEPLPDETGNIAEFANPMSTLANQFAFASKVAGWSNFTNTEIGRWAKSYKKFMTLPEGLSGSHENYFKYGKFNSPSEDMPQIVINTAEHAREYIRGQLRHPSSGSVRRNNAARATAKIVAWSIGDTHFKPESYWRALNKISSGKVITELDIAAYLKGMAYTYHLGLGNISQLWVQASGALPSVAMYPKYGLAALKDLPILIILQSSGFNNQIVAAMAPKFAALRGSTVEEALLTIGEFKRTHLGNIGQTDVMRDGVLDVNSIVPGSSGAMRTAQMAPMFAGDFVSRVVAWGVAHRRARELSEARGLIPGRAKTIQFLQGETNRLLLNMMSGGESTLSRGFYTGLAFQMRAYGLKYTETLAGLNRGMTAKEAKNVALWHTAFFGAMAVPFLPEVIDAVAQKMDEKIERSTLELLMYGLTDQVIGAALGYPTAAGARVGAGDAYVQLFKIPFDSMLAGAFGLAGDDLEDIKKATGALQDLLVAQAVLSAETGELDPAYLTADVFQTLATLFSSSSAYSKGYWVAKSKLLLNSSGSAIKDWSPIENGFATAIGITSAEEALAYRMYPIQENRKALIAETAKHIAALRISIAAAVKEDNFEYAQHMREVLNVMANMMDNPEVWASAEDKASFMMEGMPVVTYYQDTRQEKPVVGIQENE